MDFPRYRSEVTVLHSTVESVLPMQPTLLTVTTMARPPYSLQRLAIMLAEVQVVALQWAMYCSLASAHIVM